MKVFFDRNVPFFLVEEHSFYTNEVEVPVNVMKAVTSLNQLAKDMKLLIESNGAAERCAQCEADALVNGITQIFAPEPDDGS